MTLYKIQELINSEGPIVTILKDDNDSLFTMGNTENGKKIITKTNHFILSLYLQSRITLKELYLLNQDNFYLVIEGGQTVERFFEIYTSIEPEELTNLRCGYDLFGLLPTIMKSKLNPKEILDLLPNPFSKEKDLTIEDLDIEVSQMNFFNEDILAIVNPISEKLNPFECDYIRGKTLEGKEIFAKINPYSLFLYLNNRISTKEFFLCRQHEDYIINDGNKTRLFKYTKGVKALLKYIHYSDLTYFSLPSKIQVEDPIESWKFYTDYITISGRNVIFDDVNRVTPIELKII